MESWIEDRDQGPIEFAFKNCDAATFSSPNDENPRLSPLDALGFAYWGCVTVGNSPWAGLFPWHEVTHYAFLLKDHCFHALAQGFTEFRRRAKGLGRCPLGYARPNRTTSENCLSVGCLQRVGSCVTSRPSRPYHCGRALVAEEGPFNEVDGDPSAPRLRWFPSGWRLELDEQPMSFGRDLATEVSLAVTCAHRIRCCGRGTGFLRRRCNATSSTNSFRPCTDAHGDGALG